MTTVNRKFIREGLTTLLRGYLPPTYNIFDHRKIVIAGLSPIILVASGPVRRPRKTNLGSMPVFKMYVISMVLHTDEENNWTEDMAEDMIDDIENRVADFVEVNQKTPYWDTIDYDTETVLDRYSLGGKPYLTEMIVLNVEAKR